MKVYHCIIIVLFLSPIHLLSQCYPDRHNTSWSDAWISCETRKSPNPNRGLSHWILYDLGKVYPLGIMHIWNLNIPGEENSGIKSMVVDYLLDEENSEWQNLGTFEVDKGPGSSIYEGKEVTDWEGAQARYVLLTFPENYGGNCTGFSEIKFDLHEAEVMTHITHEKVSELSVQAYPNPFKNKFILTIQTDIRENVRYKIVNVLGQVLIDKNVPVHGLEQIEINTAKLPAGNYFIFVEQGESSVSQSLICIP